MSVRRVEVAHSESGAVLILALVYIIAISLIVGALARWATNDLNNTNNFGVTSQLHIAETSAMNTAIESIRYTPWPSGSGGASGTGEAALPTNGQATGWGWCFQPPASVGGTVSSMVIGSFTIDVYCNTVEEYDSSSTRVVTFAACPNTTTTAACEARPLLSAVVVYDDYPEGGGLLLATQCNQQGVACGEGRAIQSWVWL